MLTYNLAEAAGSLYEFLYRKIRDDIISGAIPPGTRLPSKRALARNYGISVITAQSAYEQLLCEGYARAEPRRGYYAAAAAGKRISPRKTAVSLDIALPAPEPRDFISISGNNADPGLFPFAAWARMTRKALTENPARLMEIPVTGGLPELRKAISRHLSSFRGLLADPDQIIIGAGTEYLYSLIIQLLGRDRLYATENPGYPKLMSIYRSNDVRILPISMDSDGIRVSELEEFGAEIAHITPNHHFPTGITMPAGRRFEMLSWSLKREGRYIIEDDYDSEFRVTGLPLPTLFSSDGAGRVIYLNTFAKTLTPTIRISYMALPPDLADLFYRKLSFYSCTVSSFEQLALAEFINQGFLEKHINKMRLYYTRKRESILKAIDASGLGAISRVHENRAGLHFLLELRADIPDRELKERLRERKILVKTLSEYHVPGDQAPEHFLLINYSSLDPVKAEQAFREIAAVAGGKSGSGNPTPESLPAAT